MTSQPDPPSPRISALAALRGDFKHNSRFPGQYVYNPSIARGPLTASQLRQLADHLDNLNSPSITHAAELFHVRSDSFTPIIPDSNQDSQD